MMQVVILHIKLDFLEKVELVEELLQLFQKMAICVYSPRLNIQGNSLIGTKALELFTTKTGLSIFLNLRILDYDCIRNS